MTTFDDPYDLKPAQSGRRDDALPTAATPVRRTADEPALAEDAATDAPPTDAPATVVPAAAPALRLLPRVVEPEGFVRTWFYPLVALAVAAAYFAFALTFWGPAHPGNNQNGYLVGGLNFAGDLFLPVTDAAGNTRFNLDTTGAFSTGMTPREPYGFVGLMWMRAFDGMHYPKYPLGLPVLNALAIWAARLAGRPEQAYVWAHLVSPICGALGLVGTFLLARRVAGSFAGLLAMVMLGFGQAYLILAVNPSSHAATVMFAVWGMYFLVLWWQTGFSLAGAAAGFALGAAMTVRYTEGLLLLPLALACVLAFRPVGVRHKRFSYGLASLFGVGLAAGCWGLLQFKAAAAEGTPSLWLLLFGIQNTELFAGHPAGYFQANFWFGLLLFITLCCGVGFVVAFSWRQWHRVLPAAVPLLAWCVPAAFLFMTNLAELGHLTGYDLSNESVNDKNFTYQLFIENWERTIRQLYEQGLFFVAPLGLTGLGLLLARHRRLGLLLFAWLVPTTLLYTAYYYAPEMSIAYQRFFLSVFPAVAVGAAFLFARGVLEHPNVKESRLGRVLAPVAVAGVVLLGAYTGTYRAIEGNEADADIGYILATAVRSNQNLAGLGEVVAQHASAGDVVLAGGNFMTHDLPYHLQAIDRYELYREDAFSRRGFNGAHAPQLRPGNHRRQPQPHPARARRVLRAAVQAIRPGAAGRTRPRLRTGVRRRPAGLFRLRRPEHRRRRGRLQADVRRAKRSRRPMARRADDLRRGARSGRNHPAQPPVGRTPATAQPLRPKNQRDDVADDRSVAQSRGH